MSVSLQFQYLVAPVQTSNGLAMQLVSGSGVRTFTNRFGVSTTAAITLSVVGRATNLLYLNSTSPVDSVGIAYAVVGSGLQLPGLDPTQLWYTLGLRNASVYAAELYAQSIDPLGSAFLSSMPGVLNSTIGAGNTNALAANYAACKAPITFSNGLRAPTQPRASNSAARYLFSYFISDGVRYSVMANLTLIASSAFATTQDLLGNPYQTLVNITGTRLYTYLLTGQQLQSTVTYLPSQPYSGDQRFYPYSLLASTPGLYSMNSAPFVDYAGLMYAVSPPAPIVGLSLSDERVPSVRLYQRALPPALVEDGGEDGYPPLPGLQQQTLQLL